MLGFGSTAAMPIQANGVHYDCGCVLTETGDLQQFGGNGSTLSVPSVYVAYFSTFGAMVCSLTNLRKELFLCVCFHFLGFAFASFRRIG